MRTYFATYLAAHATATPMDAVDLTESFPSHDASVGVAERLREPTLDAPLRLYLVEGDLFAPFAAPPSSPPLPPILFDLILFNPPYVPTSQAELDDALQRRDIITAAWCGGPRGRVVLDRFLAALPLHLAAHGVCYIVLIKENDVADVYATIETAFTRHAAAHPEAAPSKERGVSVACVAERYTGEHLSIHRITYAS
ncbi:hypothetical protein STCU_05155 [Strigomonas culicis]|nr:hypothetical protein STCU_05155 [Strigomonas culicis]|eukprot:EPY28390.1 hypothetical protein STCU_05155 [Strigomonas culicis]